MVTPVESKTLLSLLAADAEDTARWMLGRTTGSFESRRLQLLDTVPGVVEYYSEGSAALATDLYDDARVGVQGRYAVVPVILDRTVKIRRSIAWAAKPLEVDDPVLAGDRLVEVVRSEIARPYRDTILVNGKNDGKYVGYKRIARGESCGFCKALADRGAVYREDTAYFASHDNCMCTAAPAFVGQPHGPEASVMQYLASGRRRTAAERARINEWAASYETQAA